MYIYHKRLLCTVTATDLQLEAACLRLGYRAKAAKSKKKDNYVPFMSPFIKSHPTI